MDPWKIVLVLILMCVCNIVYGDEALLYNKLSSGYNKKIRPLTDHTQSVKVKVDFELIKIVDLDEKTEVLKTVGKFILTWYDDHLKWIPAAFGDIESMVVPPTLVWLPDVGLENSADTFYHTTFHTDFHVRLFYNGLVEWSFGGEIATLCSLDMTYFPFDLQKCVIQIENWAYHGHEVTLRNKTHEIATDAYEEHGVWKLTSTKAAWRNVYFLAVGPEPIPEVDFTMFIERKPKFYILNLVLPCLLIITVALGVFWLPAESGEKVSLGVTLLLAFSVFQIVLSDQTPVNSDFSPVLGQLVVGIMTLSSISCLTSIVILFLHHKNGPMRVPFGARKFFFRFLAAAVCMRSTVPEVSDDKIGPDQTEVKVDDIDHTDNPKMAGLVNNKSEIQRISDDLSFLTERTKRRDEDNERMDEWRALARVLDRALFWIAFIVVTIILLVFLTRKDPDHS